MTQQTRNSSPQETPIPDTIDEAALVRSAEHLRQQIIGEAFARFSRRRRKLQERAAPQFVGAYCVASSGTGSSV